MGDLSLMPELNSFQNTLLRDNPYETMSSTIETQNLSKSFSVRAPSAGNPSGATDFIALDDINLQVKAGEFLVIVGPSGCGKSTLLDLLAGLASPTRGHILIDGRPSLGPALDRSLVFQQYALFP
jgi:NitT/TauT family transport system ATP-binding protein